jgi:hypothetical protein
MNIKRLIFVTASVLALTGITGAAQQVTGVPGSPKATSLGVPSGPPSALVPLSPLI